MNKGIALDLHGKMTMVRRHLRKLITGNFFCWMATLAFVQISFSGENVLFSISPSLGNGQWYDQKTEQVILHEVNKIRMQQGLGRLKTNVRLQEEARKQSRAMAGRNVLSHDVGAGFDLRDRLKKAAFSDYYGGENIARTNCPDSSQTALAGWLQSPGHLHNILNSKYSETGIGVLVQPDGWVYLTQIFVGKDSK
jgi:uncharacterized protein YkwD